MKLIVGLGNPGKKYAGTPHNVGFDVLDILAGRFGCRLRRSLRHQARIGKAHRAGEWVHLVRPETYMNRSGSAVWSVMRKRGVGPGDMAVVLDDADLPLGRIRIRPRGSSGPGRMSR